MTPGAHWAQGGTVEVGWQHKSASDPNHTLGASLPLGLPPDLIPYRNAG